MDVYWEYFASDVFENIEKTDEAFSKYQKTADYGTLQNVYYAMHTIKGNGAIMELKNISSLAGCGEKLSTIIQRDTEQPKENCLILLKAIHQRIKDNIEDMLAAQSDLSLDTIQDLLDAYQQEIAHWDTME